MEGHREVVWMVTCVKVLFPSMHSPSPLCRWRVMTADRVAGDPAHEKTDMCQRGGRPSRMEETA